MSLEQLKEDFQITMEQIKISLIDLKQVKTTGRDMVSKFCEFLRQDIEIEVDSKIDEMRRVCTLLTNEITEYEDECLANMEHDDSNKTLYETAISDATAFLDTWSNSTCINTLYKRFKIDVDGLIENNQAAEIIRHNLDDCKRQIKSAHFGHKKLNFNPTLKENILGTLRSHSTFRGNTLKEVARFAYACDTMVHYDNIHFSDDGLVAFEALPNGLFVAIKSDLILLYNSRGDIISHKSYSNIISTCRFGNCIIMSQSQPQSSNKHILGIFDFNTNIAIKFEKEILIDDVQSSDIFDRERCYYAIAFNNNDQFIYCIDFLSNIFVYNLSLQFIFKFDIFTKQSPSNMVIRHDIIFVQCGNEILLIDIKDGHHLLQTIKTGEFSSFGVTLQKEVVLFHRLESISPINLSTYNFAAKQTSSIELDNCTVFKNLKMRDDDSFYFFDDYSFSIYEMQNDIEKFEVLVVD